MWGVFFFSLVVLFKEEEEEEEGNGLEVAVTSIRYYI